MSELSSAAQAAADTFRALCAELTAWAEKTSAHYLQPPDVLQRARASMADEPPEPAPPADGEVAEFVEWLQEEADDYECIGCEDSAAKCRRAAELLPLQQLVPVSVSERLPGPEDCDSHGWCWVLYSAHSTWTLEPPYGQDGMPTGWTHWLPAHALPLPEVGE